MDSNNVVVKIKAVNWYGGHCSDGVPNGLDRQHVDSVANIIADNGFNTVRLQYSNEMIRDNYEVRTRTLLSRTEPPSIKPFSRTLL